MSHSALLVELETDTGCTGLSEADSARGPLGSMQVVTEQERKPQRPGLRMECVLAAVERFVPGQHTMDADSRGGSDAAYLS